jgi:DNA-binding response OmpR family regulator
MRILVVDDAPDVVESVRLGFTLQWREVEVIGAARGEHGLDLVEQERPDLVLLDVGLPDIDGYEVLRQIRAFSDVPVVMLTARDDTLDLVKGLEAGADDYVTKPFSVNELIARMRAIFRRASRPGAAPEIVEIGDAKVNFSAHSLHAFGTDHALSFYEVELLRLLVERAGQPVSRDEILQKIWGLDASPTNRTVDNFIVKLRKKIEKSPDKPAHILTVYGFGYKLATEVGT